MENNDQSFAERLNQLFEEKRKPNGTRYSRKEVLESIPALTRIYLWRLQTGKVARPAYEIVTALAEFFGVTPEYLFPASEVPRDPTKPSPTEELQVILRGLGFDNKEREAVLLMIEAIKKNKQAD